MKPTAPENHADAALADSEATPPPVTHISELDAARLDAATERAIRAATTFRMMQLENPYAAVLKAAQDAETARLAMLARVKSAYGLAEGDTVDPVTGAITRAPVTPST